MSNIRGASTDVSSTWALSYSDPPEDLGPIRSPEAIPNPHSNPTSNPNAESDWSRSTPGGIAASLESAGSHVGTRSPYGAVGSNGRSDTTPHEKILSDLLHWEGDIHHMYLDKVGLVTVGVGNLLGSSTAAQQLPFVDKTTGRPATAAQIAQAFETVSHLEKGHNANSFAAATPLRLPEDAVRTLATARLENEFLPGLRRRLPEFDNYPAPAQRALVDMAYNMGLGKLDTFPKLLAACKAGDWAAAAADCHRRTCRAERNDWTRDLFIEAAASTNGNGVAARETK